MISILHDPRDLHAGWGVSTCKGCGAPIVWCHTDKGKRFPMDLQPGEGGPFEVFAELFPDGSAVDPGVQRARPRPSTRAASSPGWWPHWVTCPLHVIERIPAELVEQLGRVVARKWGPLFAPRSRGRA